MSQTLRRIAGVAAIAMVAAVVLAPHAQATVTTNPVVTLVGADHKTPVGQAVYTMTQTKAEVAAVLSKLCDEYADYMIGTMCETEVACAAE